MNAWASIIVAFFTDYSFPSGIVAIFFMVKSEAHKFLKGHRTSFFNYGFYDFC